MTILIHEVNKAEELFFKDDTVPDPISTDNSEFNIFQKSSSANYRVERRIIGTTFAIRVWEFLRRPQQESPICRENTGTNHQK